MLYQRKNSIGKNYLEMIRYKDFEWEQHLHRHYELVYVREGALMVYLPFCSEIIKEGECAFIPANTLHSFKTDKSSLVDVCIFSADFVPLFKTEIAGRRPEGCKFICKKSILAFAESELFVENHLPNLYTAKSVLYAITGEIIRQIQFLKSVDNKEILLDKLIEYVSINYKNDISLDSAAESLGYEKHYLSRCFRSVIPIHFSKYVNILRIDAATELLQYSNLPITEIALQSGFQSIRTFNRVFLEITGKSPREYYKSRL